MKRIALWLSALALVLLPSAAFAQYGEFNGGYYGNQDLYGNQGYYDQDEYQEYLNEIAEARNDLATGEIGVEEYYSEIQEAEQMLYDQDYGWNWGTDNYGYYYGDYDYEATDWDENWYGDADQWFDWDIGYDTDYGYGNEQDWDWGF